MPELIPKVGSGSPGNPFVPEKRMCSRAISITKRANGRRNWQYPMLREATGNPALPSTNGVMHGSFTTVHVETNSISTSRGLNRTEKSPNIPLVTVRSTKPEPRSSRPLRGRVSGSPPSRARRNTGSITEDTGTTPESMRASVSSLENLTWNPRGSMKYQWGPRAGPEFPPTALWWASARMEIPGSPTAISTPPFGELPLPPFVRKTRLGAPVDAYPQAASDRIAPFPLFPLMERVISVSAGHPTNVSTRLIKPPQSCSPPFPPPSHCPRLSCPDPQLLKNLGNRRILTRLPSDLPSNDTNGPSTVRPMDCIGETSTAIPTFPTAGRDSTDAS